MAQPQQVIDPNVNPPPTEQELLEYRVAMDRLTSTFCEEVQVRGVNAYTKLIHDLKITVCKYNSDLVEADEQVVLKSIKRHDGQHFKQGFVVKVRATSSREYHPDFSAAQYDTEVHSAICKLHLDAADMSRKMADIHYNLTLIKTKVSPYDFIKISTSIPLPLTTVEIVDPAKPSAVDIDSLRICDHMPDPSKLSGHKPTKLLAALVRFQMQNILCKTQGTYPMLKCEEDFGLGRTAFERIVSGIRRAGGHEYERLRAMGPNERPTSMTRQKEKRQNPMDKGPTGLVSGTVHQCKFCEKSCTSESGLTNHINNVHQERQNIFRCCKCGRKYNVFNMYIEHLGTHPKNEYRCHECGKQFKDAHLLSLHSPTHLLQCPFCSRTFKDMKLLENHVNNTHGQALAEENKKCSYCDVEFETVQELQEHSKIHRYFSCEICFAGFMLDVILIQHKIHDHPEGPVPSTSGVTDPQGEQAPIICVPDPDPFEEKLDTRIGLVNPDRNHQVKCEECDRFLKSKKLRKLHVMCYHLMAAYQCPFDPNIIFYTKDDLVLHCKQNHVLCKLCDTMSVNQASLEEHYRKRHPKSPPPKVQPAATSIPNPADKPESEQVEPSQEDQAKTQPQTQPDQPTPAIQANVRPVRGPTGKYNCNLCKKSFGTMANFRLHLNIHRKVSCKFCYRKFLNVSSMDEHVKEVHKASNLPQYRCKLDSCTEWFGTQIESFRHLRNEHRSLLRYRCKKCKDSFFTVEELFRHHKIHDKNHLPFEAKWSCSRCGEIFDNLTQLMEHTRIHTENSYECDECNWRFALISELTIHGGEFHDTREHTRHWCTRYFHTPELLLQHGNRKHNFECCMCNDAFPSEDQLTAHQVVQHGKPITEVDEWRERMKEAQEKKDKRREQRQRRKEATSTPATFICNQCVNFFSSQKGLDDNTCKYHTFICQICQHVSKTLPELDFHGGVVHDTTPRELPEAHPKDEEMVRGWRDRTMVEDRQKELNRWRDIKDTAAREKWAECWAAGAAQKSLDEEKEKGKKRKYDTKEESEAAAGDDKESDPDYVQSEEGSSQDPLYEPL